MPDTCIYKARVWVIKDGQFIEKCGMVTYHLSRAVDFTYAFSRQSEDDGFATVSDVASGGELHRITFNQNAKAAAA